MRLVGNRLRRWSAIVPGRLVLFIACALLSLGGAFGCTERSEEGTEKKLVLVSIVPQKFFIERIAGDLVRVEVMIPPGANPESYEPSFAHLRSFSKAALYLTVGPGLQLPFEQQWLAKLHEEVPGLRMVHGGAAMAVEEGDPHLWLSPAWARVFSRNAADALSQLFPERAEQFRSELVKLEAEIEAVEERIRTRFAEHNTKAFASYHPTWSYFASHFGLEQISIEDEGKEPGPAELKERTKEIRSRGIKTLLLDHQLPIEIPQALASELGIELSIVDPLAYSWLENLDKVAETIARTS